MSTFLDWVEENELPSVEENYLDVEDEYCIYCLSKICRGNCAESRRENEPE